LGLLRRRLGVGLGRGEAGKGGEADGVSEWCAGLLYL
jgi:hypothetical protein